MLPNDRLNQLYLFVTVMDNGPPEEGFTTGAAQAAEMITTGDVSADAANLGSLRWYIISATRRRRSSRIHLFKLFLTHASNNPAASAKSRHVHKIRVNIQMKQSYGLQSHHKTFTVTTLLPARPLSTRSGIAVRYKYSVTYPS